MRGIAAKSCWPSASTCKRVSASGVVCGAETGEHRDPLPRLTGQRISLSQEDSAAAIASSTGAQRASLPSSTSQHSNP